MAPDRPALETESEITPAMIDAGVSAWADFRPGDRSDWLVVAVYEAMEAARTNAPSQPRQPRPLPSPPLPARAFLQQYIR